MRILLSASVLLLLYCSSSSAYDQQYQVGGIGPNGGTVTNVTVVPELSNVTDEMVGDFLETTYTYTYTETVDEVVSQTAYQTITITEEKTQQLIDAATITATNTSTNCYVSGVDYCTAGQQLGGGSILYEMDTSAYDNKRQIDYGSTVNSHVSNSSLPPCSQTNSDCQDEFKITVRLYDDGILQNTYNHVYASVNWAGSRDYDFTQDVSGASFDTATLELYGMDAGYYSGFYGPAFSNTYFDLTYDYIYQAIQQVITQTELTTILSTNEYEYDSQYIPPPLPLDSFDAIEMAGVDTNMTFELDLQPLDGPVTSFEIEVIDSPTGDFEIRVVDAESFEELPEMDIGGPDDGPRMEDTPEDTTEVVREGGTSPLSQTDNIEEPETDQQPVAGNTQRRNSGASTAAYNAVMQTVKLVMMNQSDAVRQFDTYKQVSIPSTSFYAPENLDGGVNYDNPMGRYYSGASDVLWDNMVEMQWQR